MRYTDSTEATVVFSMSNHSQNSVLHNQIIVKNASKRVRFSTSRLLKNPETLNFALIVISISKARDED